ncbi:hypothetical protein SUDANB105_00820 [Streptomyces sp. enrichment culture]
MRVAQSYTNTDGAWAKKLTLHWPHGNEKQFSYDLGGVMRGGDWDGQMFCAEVKWRRNSSDQGTEYKSFLAKCYVALSKDYMLGDHYMWISWRRSAHAIGMCSRLRTRSGKPFSPRRLVLWARKIQTKPGN